jgi:four helix bundle protein
MKFQHPTSNIQKSSKVLSSSHKRGLVYPQPISAGWILNEPAIIAENGQHPFDLQERTALFGEAIVRFCKQIRHDSTTDPLKSQLVRCGTSIGANYIEANESFSRKDFRYSISRCVKEAKETKYFLRMVAASEASHVENARNLYREGHELHMIFAAIFRKGQK